MTASASAKVSRRRRAASPIFSPAGASRRGHRGLYDDINASEGRSNLDIEKHLRRSEVEATHAQVWLALARELGNQGDRYGHPGT
jgi:hypothetical protein